MNAIAEERHRAALLTSLARILVVAVIFAGEWIRWDEPPLSLGFDLILAAAGLYAATALVVVLFRWRVLVPGWGIAMIDLILLGALTYSSAGELSTVRNAFFLVPVLAAFTQGPPGTMLIALATPVAFLGAALAEGSGDGTLATASVLFLLLVGGVSVAVSQLLAARAGRIQRLADDARAFSVRAVEAGERERRRLSYAIHDEPIQHLLAAQLQLDRATRGDVESARSVAKAIKEALQTLRELTLHLYPHSHEQLGLGAMLGKLADAIAHRSGIEIVLQIDERDVGERDALCLAVVRELLRNAAEHASASRIEVLLGSQSESLRIVVSDDGKGIPEGRVDEALREGHIGLAMVFERTRAAGGRTELSTSNGTGTTVEVTLPRHVERRAHS